MLQDLEHFAICHYKFGIQEKKHRREGRTARSFLASAIPARTWAHIAYPLPLIVCGSLDLPSRKNSLQLQATRSLGVCSALEPRPPSSQRPWPTTGQGRGWGVLPAGGSSHMLCSEGSSGGSQVRVCTGVNVCRCACRCGLCR